MACPRKAIMRFCMGRTPGTAPKKEAPGIDCRAPLRRSAQSQSWQLSVVSVQLWELLGVPQLLIVVGVLLKNVMS